MRPFKYTRSTDINAAVKLVSEKPNARFLAGGTNILDLMKEDVERPTELVDISGVKLTHVRAITKGENAGGLSIGAAGKNSDTANHPLVRERYPLLSAAILAGASAQIRNMASNGGNLLQRTRCPYFYDVAMPCNKREKGSGCGALEGFNRMHAIFGWSESCVAVYPSDMAVALAALDAVVKVTGTGGKQRSILFKDFHLLPGDTPEKETCVERGEIITEIELPPAKFSGSSYYLKVRDRASYAFALVSVAAGLQVEGNRIVSASLALGGVAHKPWRVYEAEKILVGREISEALFVEAAEAAMQPARPLSHNKFKIELGKQGIVRALNMAAKTGQTNI
ncbi:FAD binding domain-containing protein [Flavitalea antarctica]